MRLLNLTVVKSSYDTAVYNQYGKLVAQDGEIDWINLLRKNVCMITSVVWADEDWAEVIKEFPTNFSDVQLSEVQNG